MIAARRSALRTQLPPPAHALAQAPMAPGTLVLTPVPVVVHAASRENKMSGIDVGNDLLGHEDDDDEWEDMDEDVGEEEGEDVPAHLRPPAVATRRLTLPDTR
jgi:hypothetical protein